MTSTGTLRDRNLAESLMIGIGALVVGALLTFQTSEPDSARFFESARGWLAGGSLYAARDNLNPPHFHLIMLPLVGLTDVMARAVWFGLSATAAVATLLLVRSELHVPPLRLAVALAMMPSLVTFAVGQVAWLLSLPLTLAWRAARQGRWNRAGAWLGLLIPLKPFLAPLGLWLLLGSRSNRAVAALASTAGATLLAGIIVFGWTAYVEWLSVLGSVEWVGHYLNASWMGILERTFADRNPYWRPALDWPAVIQPAWIAVIVATGAVLIWRRPGNPDRGIAAWLLWALIASPLGWMYYGVLAVGPVLALWPAMAPPVRAGVLATAITPSMWTYASDAPGAAVTIGSVYGWGLLALWFAVMFSPRESRDASRLPSRRAWH